MTPFAKKSFYCLSKRHYPVFITPGDIVLAGCCQGQNNEQVRTLVWYSNSCGNSCGNSCSRAYVLPVMEKVDYEPDRACCVPKCNAYLMCIVSFNL